MKIGRIFYDLISDSKSEEENGGRQDQIDCLESPAPFEPFAVADTGNAKADQQSGICGIENVGEAVAECKSNDAKLCGNTEDLRHGNDQRNQHESFCRSGRNEEVHYENDCINEQNDSPFWNDLREVNGAVQDRVQDACFF